MDFLYQRNCPMFQFTLPRGERRSCDGVFSRSRVSIHAPTRGATFSTLYDTLDTVFQFTLPRGERPYRDPQGDAKQVRFNSRSHTGSDNRKGYQRSIYCSFQFTLPHGERLRQASCLPALLSVSIHAPTRGATFRTPKTSDSSLFQFTLPHGERLLFASNRAK